MKNVAVILAGGSGQRLGANIPKQFLKIAGKPIIEHTIEIFEKNVNIHEIVVVSHVNFLTKVEEIVLKGQFKKVKKILAGGKERYHSSLAAINAYDEEVNLIFHDSVRPLLNNRIINDCISALTCYNAVDVAIPTTDTIIQVSENSFIETIPHREILRNGQTPQAFKHSTIKAAYDLALKDPNFVTTDDCGVVLKYLPQEPIYVVEGDQFNQKLTYKEDLFLLDKLFQLKTLSEKDFHNANISNLKNKVVVVFGGTEGIGESIVTIAKQLGMIVYSASRRTGVDVSNRKDVSNFLKEIFHKKNRIDFVINTAGILDKQPLASMTYEDILKSININYIGSIIIAKESFEYLQMTKGMLLLFTSSSYTKGRALYSLYSSSKAAIVNLTQALSEEWSSFGVKINCINPERTLTPMRIKNFGNEPKSTLLSADEVAEASIAILTSEITGQIMDIKK